MNFNNDNWPIVKTMVVYDYVEPLPNPVGFVIFESKPETKKETALESTN